MKTLVKSLLVSAFAFSCAAAMAADQVVLYSSNNVDTIDVVKDAFEAKCPDVTISVVHAGTGSLMQRIKAEARNPMGDIFWSGGLSTINQYTEYQEPYSNANTSKIAASLKDPDNHWVATNIHVAVLMVNTNQLEEDEAVPTTWKELTDPKWKGLIVCADPASSGTAYSTLFGLKEIVGAEDFKKIVQNMVIVNSSAGAYEGPARGEFTIGITMEYAACEYIEGGLPNIEIVYPEEGTVTMPEGMFILKDAKNMDSAKKLYDFLSSEEAQEALFSRTYRRPAIPTVDVGKYSKLPKMDSIKVHEVDPKISGDMRDEFLKEFSAIVEAAQ